MSQPSATRSALRTLDDLRKPFVKGCGDRFPQAWARLVAEGQIGGLEDEAAAVRRIVVAAMGDADPFIAYVGPIMAGRLALTGGGLVAAL